MISDDDYEYNSPLQCVRTSLVSFQKKWGALARGLDVNIMPATTLAPISYHLPKRYSPDDFLASAVLDWFISEIMETFPLSHFV